MEHFFFFFFYFYRAIGENNYRLPLYERAAIPVVFKLHGTDQVKESFMKLINDNEHTSPQTPNMKQFLTPSLHFEGGGNKEKPLSAPSRAHCGRAAGSPIRSCEKIN